MKYIAYCRKSTDEKDKQVMSIDQQISEVKEFAARENLEIVDFLTEAQTAKVTGRPIFNNLIKRIEKGEAQGIVSWNPDRLARNSVDGGKIIYLLDLGKLQSLKFPTHWFENTPQGRFMLSIAFGQAKYYVDNLSQNVHRGLKYKIKQGVWPARAPMGYRNDRNTKNIVVYEPEAKVIKKAFELYATGNHSLHAIGEFFLENGIKNKISGDTPNDSNLRRLLMRPFYTGYMVYKGELHEGTHEPLISKELFDKCQVVRKQRGYFHQNKSKRYNFAFTGLIKCAYCEASITAEHRPFYFPRTHHKADYIYYHCTKKKGPCCQKGYTREEVLEKQFREIIKSSGISDFIANTFYEFLEKDVQTEKEEIGIELKKTTDEFTAIDQKLDRLLEAYLETLVEADNYKQKKNELTERRIVLKETITRLKDGNPIWIERVKEFIKTASECTKIARAEKNCHELKLMAKKVGSKYFLKDQKIEFSLLPPFQALAASPLAASATLDSSRIFAFGQSKYFVDNLRENVKRGLRQKIRNGVWPGWAPVGYLNNPKTRLIDIDRGKTQKVKKLFELYSTGRYTLKSLANWCKEKGLRGNLGKEIAVSNVQKILANPFYIGLMKYRGEIFEGQHEPLISKKLFDKCQEVMSKRGKVQEVRKHNFAFLGLMKCASCGCSITAEIQKGHNYYRCTKKKGACQEKHYLREEILSEQIKSFLQKVSLSSQDTEKVLAALDSEQEQAKQQAKSKVEILKEQLKQVDIKLGKLLDVFLTDALSTEEYAAKKQELLSQKMELQEKITDFGQKGLSWLEPAREFILSLNQAAKLVETENKEEMTTFLKNIGSNHILRNRQLIFSPKIPYNLIAERSEANRNRLQIPYWCCNYTLCSNFL